MKKNFCLVCFSTIQTIKLVLQLEDLVDILDEKTLSLLISIKHVEKMGKQIIQMTWCLWVLLRQIGLVKIWKMTQINQPIFFLTNNNVIKIVLESKGGGNKIFIQSCFQVAFWFFVLNWILLKIVLSFCCDKQFVMPALQPLFGSFCLFLHLFLSLCDCSFVFLYLSACLCYNFNI